MQWAERALAEYGSARQIGRLVHGGLPRKLKTRWKPGHLGNKVSELMKGNGLWWADTGLDALPVLAQLLGVQEFELVAPVQATPDELPFPEFPALPPLTSTEAPYAPGGADVLLTHVFREAKPSRVTTKGVWITAPPGSGKSLAVRYFASRPELAVRAAQVETIEAALALKTDGADLVIEVAHPTQHDLAPLSALWANVRSCVVLAGFPIPLRENRTGATGLAFGWWCQHLAGFLPWRAHFAEWIVGRIGQRKGRKTQLDLPTLSKWLDENDPSGRIVASPGDLLALCADFDAHGAEGAGLGKRAKRWLRDIGMKNVGDHVSDTWRDRLATRAYAGLLDAQVRDLRVSLTETTAESWEDLVPPTTAPRKPRGQLDAPLVISAFREAELLRRVGAGVVAYPRWVAQGCLETALERDFDSKDPGVWGRLAADSSRAPLVDGALDRLSRGSFRKLVRSVTQAFDPTSLGKRAALEAVFASAARRLRAARQLDPRDADPWQSMMQIQLGQLEGRGESVTPYTRRESDEFLADAWTLSVRVPALVLDEPIDDWLVPGWCAAPLSLDAVPREAHCAVFGGGAFDPLFPPRRLCEIAPDVVARLPMQDLPDSLPRVLLPALLADTAREWPLRPAHLSSLGPDTFEEGELRRLGEALGADQRGALASRVWRLLAAGEASVVWKIELLLESFPRLAPFVLTHVAAETVCETVRGQGLHVGNAGASAVVERSPVPLLHLPPEVIVAAVREWSTCPARLHAKWVEAQSLMSILGRDDVELVLTLAGGGDEQTAIQIARFVWEHDAEAARAEVEKSVESCWYESAPRAELPFVAAHLQEPFPEWVRRWAYARAPEAGSAAEVLYAISMVPAEE